jgi:glycosyl transferase family 1
LNSFPEQGLSKQLVLFRRDFRKFTGGHLKVWNYFNHVLESPSHDARIAFTAESRWDETNPWIHSRSSVIDWDPGQADILFLAGTDWRTLASAKAKNFSKPVINLIQHPRHADPKDELYGFLANRAIRICVSEQVADAINATGKVNGPVFVIPNGIELAAMLERKSAAVRTTDVLICGLKAPDLARDLNRILKIEDRKVTCLNDWMARPEYLAQLCEARIVVTLPRPIEGFYLPALEAMACGAVLICPDCVGNRDFCVDGQNCFRPAYDAGEIASAVTRALQQTEDQRKAMLENAKRTVLEHSLENERVSFLEILDDVHQLWGGKSAGS